MREHYAARGRIWMEGRLYRAQGAATRTTGRLAMVVWDAFFLPLTDPLCFSMNIEQMQHDTPFP